MWPSSMPMHLGRDSSALEAAPKGSTASSWATAAAATVPVWMEVSSACMLVAGWSQGAIGQANAVDAATSLELPQSCR